MRRHLLGSIVAGCAGVLATPIVAPAQDARATLTMTVRLDTRTSLRVSSSQLRFDVVEGRPPAQVVVDVTAAARVRANADVVLTVEAVGRLETPPAGSAADEVAVVWFQGDPAHGEALAEAVPRVVGAWKGSGVRHARVTFSLRGAVVAGAYVQELKFVLSAP